MPSALAVFTTSAVCSDPGPAALPNTCRSWGSSPPAWSACALTSSWMVVATTSCNRTVPGHPARHCVWRCVRPSECFPLSQPRPVTESACLLAVVHLPPILLPSQSENSAAVSGLDPKAFIHERVRLFCPLRKRARSAILPWASCSVCSMSLRFTMMFCPFKLPCPSSPRVAVAARDASCADLPEETAHV